MSAENRWIIVTNYIYLLYLIPNLSAFQELCLHMAAGGVNACGLFEKQTFSLTYLNEPILPDRTVGDSRRRDARAAGLFGSPGVW